MVECPHCRKDGIGIWAKLLSGPAYPVACVLCGNPSYLPTGLMHWTGVWLQMLGLFAVVVSLMVEHWWPLIVFVSIVVGTYALTGIRARLVPMSKVEAGDRKRYGDVFLLVALVVVAAVILAFYLQG